MNIHRRQALIAAATASTLCWQRRLWAELFATPAMTEGPFYPDRLPLDQDNDLITIADSDDPADGEITHLTGRILDTSGRPISNALIEIWQCDGHGVYLHSRDSDARKDQQDKHFQGYGKFETASTGEYRFRTIKPVPYPGRPSPHIHFKISKNGREVLTSQLFIAGHEGQKSDGVYRQLGDVVDRQLVETEWKPLGDAAPGEYAAAFDIVLGRTPDERQIGT